MGKYARKKFFINKRLQLYYMFYSVIPLLVVVAFVGAITLFSQKRFISSTSAEIAANLEEIISNKANNRMAFKLIEAEKQRLAEIFSSNDENIKAATITSLLELIDEGTASQKALMELKRKIPAYKYGELDFTKKILRSSYWLLFIGLLIVLIEIALLTVFISHKVAGPVYRLMRWAQDLKEGKLASRIYLRQGDELMDVVDEFNSAGNFVVGTVKILDQTIKVLEKKIDKEDPEVKEALFEAEKAMKEVKLEEEERF